MHLATPNWLWVFTSCIPIWLSTPPKSLKWSKIPPNPRTSSSLQIPAPPKHPEVHMVWRLGGGQGRWVWGSHWKWRWSYGTWTKRDSIMLISESWRSMYTYWRLYGSIGEEGEWSGFLVRVTKRLDARGATLVPKYNFYILKYVFWNRFWITYPYF